MNGTMKVTENWTLKGGLSQSTTQCCERNRQGSYASQWDSDKQGLSCDPQHFFLLQQRSKQHIHRLLIFYSCCYVSVPERISELSRCSTKAIIREAKQFITSNKLGADCLAGLLSFFPFIYISYIQIRFSHFSCVVCKHDKISIL